SVMHRAGRKGRLPPVVERALSWYAGHGGDGSGIARWREGFWFQGQRSEVREASANPDLHMPGFGFFSLFGRDPAASLPNFFNNRCKVSRSFFERTSMAFSIAAACSRKARTISARPFPVSST